MSDMHESSRLLTKQPKPDCIPGSADTYVDSKEQEGQTMKKADTKLNIPLCILLTIFGWSSWVQMQGVWVELPLMINKLPEYWNLPSYVNATVQAANIGPVFFLALLWIQKSKLSNKRVEVAVNIMVLAIGGLACVLLAFLWQRTSFIGGQRRSFALLFLSFLVSLLDCTSSLSFPVYMSVFPTSYMIFLFIGEGLGALIPTIVAFGQGAGRYICVASAPDEKVNHLRKDYQNESILIPKLLPEAFPVHSYFLFLFAMLLLSTFAFLTIEYIPYFKQFRILRDGYKRVYGIPEYPNTNEAKPSRTNTTKKSDTLSKRDTLICLVLAMVANAFLYGIFPSFQTYSLLPYGSGYFSAGLKSVMVISPVASLVSLWVRTTQVKWLVFHFAVAMVFSIYILIFASYSPSPPLQKSVIGGILMVLAWIASNGLIFYVRVNIGLILKEKGRPYLVLFGAAVQLGGLIGAVPTILTTSVFHLLEPAQQC